MSRSWNDNISAKTTSKRKSKEEHEDLVDSICKKIITKFKLDPLSDGAGIKQLYELHLPQARFNQLEKDHCFLLTKLTQFGNDIKINTTMSLEKRLQILQHVAIKIYKMDQIFNGSGM